MTDKIQRAIKFSSKTHDLYQKQKRKGKDISYIVHPLSLGILLAKIGADDDIIAAGILHDVIEDSPDHKKVDKKMLEDRFGLKVADIVESLTESDKSLSWKDRKRDAYNDIKKMSEDSLLVKSADIIVNIRELIDDHARYGDEVFIHFKSSKQDKIDNYLNLIDLIISRWPQNPFLNDLLFLIKKLKEII